MEKEIKIIFKKPKEGSGLITVKNEYKDLSNLVGGMIECVDIGKGIDMVCNEEGKLNGLEPNLIFPYDVIVGPVFFCSSKDGDFTSLSEEQLRFVEKMIEKRQIL